MEGAMPEFGPPSTGTILQVCIFILCKLYFMGFLYPRKCIIKVTLYPNLKGYTNYVFKGFIDSVLFLNVEKLRRFMTQAQNCFLNITASHAEKC